MRIRLGDTVDRSFAATILAPVALILSVGFGPSALAQGAPVTLGASPASDATTLPAEGARDALAALPKLIEETLQRSGVPGAAVAVVHRGNTVFSEGFGLRRIGETGRIDRQTVFQLASVSKPIAATVAAVQVTKGAVSWDDKVLRHLPGFRLSDPYVTSQATIGDFFAHRSGLPHAVGDELEDLGFGRTEVIRRLAQVPLDPFRISYNYANFGITIGAEAVAAASRLDWESLSEQALYGPLGMSSTSSRHRDFLARPNRASLHALQDGRFQPLYERDPDAQSPAGGVSSNVVDLSKWLAVLLAGGKLDGRPFIAEKALMAALNPQAFSSPAATPDARPGFYGYGFNVGVGSGGRPAMNHSGAFVLGAGTHIQFIPSAEIGIIVLTNGGPVGAAEAIAFQFLDMVQNGKATRDWFPLLNGRMRPYYDPAGDLVGQHPTTPTAERKDLEAYAGRYANPYFDAATVEATGQGLVLVLGPAGQRYPLEAWGADRFAMTPRGENAPKGSLASVTFKRSEGRVIGFNIPYLDKAGLGSWRRYRRVRLVWLARRPVPAAPHALPIPPGESGRTAATDASAMD